jgi:hypothetical protein
MAAFIIAKPLTRSSSGIIFIAGVSQANRALSLINLKEIQ